MDAVLRLVEAGTGVAVVPDIVFAGRPRLRRTALTPALYRTVALARRADLAPSQAAQAFCDDVAGVPRELSATGGFVGDVQVLGRRRRLGRSGGRRVGRARRPASRRRRALPAPSRVLQHGRGRSVREVRVRRAAAGASERRYGAVSSSAGRPELVGVRAVLGEGLADDPVRRARAVALAGEHADQPPGGRGPLLGGVDGERAQLAVDQLAGPPRPPPRRRPRRAPPPRRRRATPLRRSSTAIARRPSPRWACRERTHCPANAASSIRPTSSNRSSTVGGRLGRHALAGERLRELLAGAGAVGEQAQADLPGDRRRDRRRAGQLGIRRVRAEPADAGAPAATARQRAVGRDAVVGPRGRRRRARRRRAGPPVERGAVGRPVRAAARGAGAASEACHGRTAGSRTTGRSGPGTSRRRPRPRSARPRRSADRVEADRLGASGRPSLGRAEVVEARRPGTPPIRSRPPRDRRTRATRTGRADRGRPGRVGVVRHRASEVDRRGQRLDRGVEHRADPELLLDPLLDLGGDVRVLAQELAGVLLALPELVALVGVPGAGLADDRPARRRRRSASPPG